MSDDIAHAGIVRYDNEDVVVAVQLLQLASSAAREGNVVAKRELEQRVGRFAATRGLQLLPGAAQTEWHAALRPARVGRYLGGHVAVLRRPEDSWVVADVAAHEDKSRRLHGRSGESTEVADRVTRAIKEIERAVAEIVVSWELADA